MRDTKFTKGEWSAVSSRGSSMIVAKLGVYSVVSTSYVETDSRYDAHLIATAPEMYSEIENDISNLNDDIEKLKKSIIGMDCCDDGYADIEYDIEQAEYFHDRKVNLLAKARGE